jgi:hypothetical protein
MSEMPPANDNVAVPEPANDNFPAGGDAAMESQQAAETGIDSAPPTESITPDNGETTIEPANDNAPATGVEAVPPGKQAVEAAIDRGPPSVPANDNVSVGGPANDNVAETDARAALQKKETASNEFIKEQSSAARTTKGKEANSSGDARVDAAPELPPLPDSETAADSPTAEAATSETRPPDDAREGWVPIDRAMAVQVLMEAGRDRATAESYVRAFSGQIWAGTIPAGETLFRYSDAQANSDPDQPFLANVNDAGGKPMEPTDDIFGGRLDGSNPQGSFLSERPPSPAPRDSAYGSPADARVALHINMEKIDSKDGPQSYSNNASSVQEVTSIRPALVLRGAVAFGADTQTLVLNRSDWSFGAPTPFADRGGSS